MEDTQLEQLLETTRKEMIEIMINLIYKSWMTETDKIELRSMCINAIESDPNLTTENLKRELFVGVANGYTIEDQLTMLKTAMSKL